MAQGIRQRTSFRSPKMWGKQPGKLGAACTAGKAILPMLSSGVSPKMPRTWFMETHLGWVGGGGRSVGFGRWRVRWVGGL